MLKLIAHQFSRNIFFYSKCSEHFGVFLKNLPFSSIDRVGRAQRWYKVNKKVVFGLKKSINLKILIKIKTNLLQYV